MEHMSDEKTVLFFQKHKTVAFWYLWMNKYFKKIQCNKKLM